MPPCHENIHFAAVFVDLYFDNYDITKDKSTFNYLWCPPALPYIAFCFST